MTTTKTTRDFILEELKNGPLSKRQLIEKLGFTYDRVDKSLARLVKASAVALSLQSDGSLKYDLLPQALQALGLSSTTTIPVKPVTVSQATANDPKPVTKPILNRIMIVLDNSASMEVVKHETEKSVQQTVRDIQSNAFKMDQETTISLMLFGEDVRVARSNVPAKDFKFEGFYPTERSTRLFDATNSVLSGTSGLFGLETPEDHKKYDISYLVIVITDGQDNASGRNLTWSQVQGPVLAGQEFARLLKKCGENWTVTFRTPPGGKRQLESFGVPSGNIVEWESTAQDVLRVTTLTSQGIGNYYGARSKGVRSVSNFYQPNLSNLTVADVKAALVDIKDRVKTLTVDKEDDIRPFVERNLGSYKIGTGYYQLTKPETIQSYKNLLVVERNKKNVYAGSDARSVLGLPSSGDIKVKPGNHGDWEIFVQSTSVNRKLVRGTKLVVIVN